MKKGVLLIAFGGPRDREEVEAFLEELRGRPPESELLQEVLKKYEAIGGSPFYAILERIVEGIRRRLRGVEVAYGFLYGKPKLEDAMLELENRGAIEVLLFPFWPYRSYLVKEALARAERRADELILLWRTPEPWFTHQEYIRLWATRVKEGILRFGKALLLFTAHSVPSEEAEEYLTDLRGVLEALRGFFPQIPFKLAFHSFRHGWLGPSLKEALKEAKDEGHERVIVVPVGFLCDHLETLYDLDVELKSEAEALGISMERISCLNASEDFLNFLVRRIYEAL